MEENKILNNNEEVMEVEDVAMEENVNPLEGLDEHTAKEMLKKVGMAIIAENDILVGQLKDNDNDVAQIEEQLTIIADTVERLNKEIEVQDSMVKSLEEAMGDNENEVVNAVKKQANEKIQKALAEMEVYKNDLNILREKLYELKNKELCLTAASNVLTGFGLKYGMIAMEEDN